MKARHVLLMAGLACCLGATGWADDGRHRRDDFGRHEFGRHDHHRHQIAPGGWPQRDWHDQYPQRRGGSIWFIQPYEGVRPFAYPYQPPHVIVPPPPPPAVYWYCPDPAGYYPYVQFCRAVWQRVQYP